MKILAYVLLVAGGLPVWIMVNFLWWQLCVQWLVSAGMSQHMAEVIFHLLGSVICAAVPLALIFDWDRIPDKYKRFLGLS